MIERPNQGTEGKRSLDEIVKEYWSRGRIEDIGHNFIEIRIESAFPGLWPQVNPALPYKEYVENELHKYNLRPEIAEAIIAEGDKAFIERFDAFAKEINVAIGAGVTSKEQADAIVEIATRAEAFILEYSRTRPRQGSR
ncbi:MAG: hypothetical protein B7W98_01200 [Parcubacteria group bacterium 20-58-5]|nr:MAG: hypothetical protein B7W98_01200 [Parcubacteria group bacterium 20-58-5]OYV63164.1 MAG: hypothetical protein B7X03_02890 [Parcubacteria group bacterium 21-58-10]